MAGRGLGISTMRRRGRPGFEFTAAGWVPYLAEFGVIT